jgi:hypothetical protein
MAKIGRKRKFNSILGSKLDEIKKFCKHADLSDFFGVSVATLGRFLNGTSAPDVSEILRFIRKFAAVNNGKHIDLNWLIDESDLRPGPVFVSLMEAVDQAVNAQIGPAVRRQIDAAFSVLPAPNVARPREPVSVVRRPLELIVVGNAAADETRGAMAGFFPSDPGTYFERVSIPESTSMIQIIGDSMSPVILAGQYAFMGPEYAGIYRHPKNGEIVVADVSIRDEEQAGSDARWEGVYCKRIVDAGDIWVFLSVNHTGTPFSVAKVNCRIWPVVGVWFAGKGTPPED